MAFLPQNCSNFYLVQPGIKQNLLKLHPPRRFSQKRSMAKAAALYITSRVTGNATSPKSCQEASRICKNSSAKLSFTVAAIKIGHTETFAVEMAIHPLQASFWSFLFAKENSRPKTMDKMCGKRLGCIFMQHSPPGGSKKSQTRKNSNKS